MGGSATCSCAPLFNSWRVREEAAGYGSLAFRQWTGRSVKANVGAIHQYWAYVGGQPEFPRDY